VRVNLQKELGKRSLTDYLWKAVDGCAKQEVEEVQEMKEVEGEGKSKEVKEWKSKSV